WGLRPTELSEVAEYGIDRLQQAYPGYTPEQIRRLIWETYEDDARNFAYEPVTQYKEAPYRGQYVNIDERGFRLVKDQGPRPPDPDAFNVFMIGGSTTFGYGLPDDASIPSRLQELAAAQRCDRPVRLYNFGRASYYSTQEQLLFQSLLAAGGRPDVAVFLDGL